VKRRFTHRPRGRPVARDLISGEGSTQYASSPGKCMADCYTELPLLPHRWPKLSPVLTAPTQIRMTRLSGPEWPGKYRNGTDRPYRWKCDKRVTNVQFSASSCNMTSVVSQSGKSTTNAMVFHAITYGYFSPFNLRLRLMREFTRVIWVKVSRQCRKAANSYM